MGLFLIIDTDASHPRMLGGGLSDRVSASTAPSARLMTSFAFRGDGQDRRSY